MAEEEEKVETASEESETSEAAAEAVSEPEAAAETAEAPAEETAKPAADESPAEPAAEAAAVPDDGGEEKAAPPAAADGPDFSYEDLHGMNVTELREVAAKIEHDAVHGYSTMHKEHLLPAICAALGIEAHEHHEVVGIDKEGVKARIRALKKERDEAEAAGDKARLKITRRRIRSLKRKIRKATV